MPYTSNNQREVAEAVLKSFGVTHTYSIDMLLQQTRDKR